MEYFKGYVTTKNKKCTMKFKGDAPLLTLDEVRDFPEYAGILAEDVILVDIDDMEQSEILMEIVEDKQIDCRVYQTTRGRHFLFKNSGIDKCGTHVKLACGLEADIKVGCSNSYEVLKFKGEERFIEWDCDEAEKIPKWLFPIKTKMEFLKMDAGDGRNSALFSYILTLQSNGFSKEEARETLQIINNYILKDSLSVNELETLSRDEAFEKPVFYEGKTFLQNAFGNFLKSQYYIKRINGQLHVYDNGIYVSGYRYIESKMVEVIPTIKSTQRSEVLKYLEIITPEETYKMDENLIAFRNGIYDLATDELIPFSPEHIITNRIPWDYNPNAYSELADKTLNKISCQNSEIRALLEECIGYCFFRQNELSKSFILTGSGSNGKSTYLDMVKNVLGRENYVALDMDELSEKFSTSSMFGKLANIGDDISDEFLQGRQISVFKKIVSGNDIKAENKGQDVFFFKPTVKLLFSANEIPRVRNRGFGAIKRRLVIIPFNATFSRQDADFDSGITWKLKKQDVAEYLIKLGIEGLKRVLENQEFTECQAVKEEIEKFEKDNNGVLLFLDTVDENEILNHETKEVFRRYDVFCAESGLSKMQIQTFSKEINRSLGSYIKDIRINGKRARVFVK